MDECFPEVGVVDNVPDRSLAMHVRNTPIVANSVTGLSLIFRKRLTGRSHESPVARHDESSELALATELIDNVR
jgi:hypothetical protein